MIIRNVIIHFVKWVNNCQRKLKEQSRMDNTETPLDTQGEDKLKKSGTRKLKL